MKNSQFQCDSIIFRKHFLLEALSNYLTFPLVRIGFFWQFWNLSTNSWFIYSKLHALQYLFVTRSKEEQEKDRIISNFTKIEIFSISQPNVGGNLTMRSPMLHLPKNGFPLTYSLARERIYLEIHLKEELQKRPPFSIQFIQEDNKHGYSFERRAYWFVLKATRVFHITTGRAGREWWTLC